MAELLYPVLFLFGAASMIAGVQRGRAERLPVWIWPMIGMLVVTWWVARKGGALTGRGGLAAWGEVAPRLGIPGYRRRVRDPETAELVRRTAADPARPSGIEALGRGRHVTPAGVKEGVHLVTIAEPGAGKGQTLINYQIQHQLLRSPEHLIVLEVKPNRELTDVVLAYSRPEDRVWIYTAQPRNKKSSALAVPNLSEMRNVAHALCQEDGSKDSHWNEKAATLIPEVARALSDLRGSENPWSLASNLPEVRDAIVDRDLLTKLRDNFPNVDHIADVAKEWGYIRSTANRHLDALSEARMRRVFAGDARTPQPTFRGYPGGGRDVVIVRPDQASAKREARYVVAIMDVLLRRAVEAGHAGGPGTKAILDEFASFVDLSQLGTYLELGRGGRLGISYVLQSRGQLARVMGGAEADSIIYTTDIKCVGATSDLELAKQISEWGGRSRVDYRAARQRGEVLGGWSQDSTFNVRPEEVTSQKAGDWTVVQHGRIEKVRVPRERYHHTQAASPRKGVKLWGVVKPEKYENRAS